MKQDPFLYVENFLYNFFVNDRGKAKCIGFYLADIPMNMKYRYLLHDSVSGIQCTKNRERFTVKAF